MRTRAIGLICGVLALLAVLAPGVDARRVRGGTGDDLLFGSNKADRIFGNAGADILFGKGNADRVDGGSGNDLVFGGGGADKMIGGLGNDVLFDDDSGSGDVLFGEDGNDTIYSRDGSPDKIRCGSGVDVAFVDRRIDVVNGCETVIRRDRRFEGDLVITGSNRADFFDVGDVDNILFARAGTDSIKAGEGDDLILGGGGRDGFFGEDDDDVIIDDDSASNDAIIPGEGRDTMYLADGARTSVDCSNDGDDGDNDIVFADVGDAVLDCGTVFRG